MPAAGVGEVKMALTVNDLRVKLKPASRLTTHGHRRRYH